MERHSLKGLVVFRHYVNPEFIRTVHFYKFEKEVEKDVERGYLFHYDRPYEEISCPRVFTLSKFSLSEQVEGHLNGVWICNFVFDDERGYPQDLNDIPTRLSIHRNSKLATVPTLADDLKTIFELKGESDVEELANDGEPKSKRRRGISQDLNLVPSPEEGSKQNGSPSG